MDDEEEVGREGEQSKEVIFIVKVLSDAGDKGFEVMLASLCPLFFTCGALTV